MTTRWIGGTTGMWASAANWSNGVPNANTDVLFQSGTQDVEASDGEYAGPITLSRDHLSLHSGYVFLGGSAENQTLTETDQSSFTLGANTGLVAGGIELDRGSTFNIAGHVYAHSAFMRHSTLNMGGAPNATFEVRTLDLRNTLFTMSHGARLDALVPLSDAANVTLQGRTIDTITGARTEAHIDSLSMEFGTDLAIADTAKVMAETITVGGTSVLTVSDASLSVKDGLVLATSRSVGTSSASLVLQDGAVVSVGSGGIDLYGSITLDASSTLATQWISSRAGVITASSGTVDLGANIFLREDRHDTHVVNLTLSAASGATLVLEGSIESRKQTPDHTLKVAVDGGHVVLAAAGASFAGTAEIYAGTLELRAADAIGTGVVAFINSGAATLQLDTDTDFANVISGFGTSDAIDLAAFAFAGTDPTLAWTPTSGGGTLTISSSEDRQQLNFVGAGLSLASFHVGSDSMGGSLVTHS